MSTRSLPKRSRSHEIEEESRRYVRGVFPPSWLVSDVPHDYGTDLMVEVFEARQPTGWVLEVQVKATDSPLPASGHYSLSVDVSWVNYALSRPNPVILVCYFAAAKRALWLWLRDYIRLTLDIEKPTWDQQQTVTLHVPAYKEFGRGCLGEIAGYLAGRGWEELCSQWRFLVNTSGAAPNPDILELKPLPLGEEHLTHLLQILPPEVHTQARRIHDVVQRVVAQRPVARDDIEFAARRLPRLTMWVAQQRAKMSACRSRLKQLALAAQMYAQDRGVFPSASSWELELEPYVTNEGVFVCPDVEQHGYVMNPAASTLPANSADRIPLFFDGAFVPPVGVPIPAGRHLGHVIVAFTHGAVRDMLPDDLARSLV